MVAVADPLFDLYARLWTRARGEGTWVHYGVGLRGEAGFFDSREGSGRSPRIVIHRPYYLTPSENPSRERSTTPLTDAELNAELITLAHEYGHSQSWLRSVSTGGDLRATWEHYHAATRSHDEVADHVGASYPTFGMPYYNALREAYASELGAHRIGLILDEEATAWRIGRETLAELGHVDFAGYDERTDNGLHLYRFRFGLEDARPSDGL